MTKVYSSQSCLDAAGRTAKAGTGATDVEKGGGGKGEKEFTEMSRWIIVKAACKGVRV